MALFETDTVTKCLRAVPPSPPEMVLTGDGSDRTKTDKQAL